MLRKNYAVIFYVLILMFALYSIFKAYGFTYFPDEFGYWMYAAKAAGYDWTNIASIGSYYSYGYSIILFPIFSLFKNAVTAYRVAVAMNFVLIGIAYFLLLRLGKDLEIKAAVALCYPPLLFYAKSTMVEVLLAVMFIVICALLYSYIDKGKSYTLVGIILGLVYIHFVHMRAVGVLLAGILTLIIYFALEKKKIGKLLVTIVGAAVVLIIGFAIKEVIMNSIYQGDSTVSDINDYAGQIYKIKYIFTADGIKDFLESLVGKLLYMGLSTFGLAWLGIVYSIKKISCIREDKHNVVHIFILISTISELLITTIYNIFPIRVDNLVYGRYHEFVFPVLIMFGLCELEDMKAKVKVPMTAGITIGIVIIQALFTYLVTDGIDRYGLTNMHGYVMAGISYLYDSGNYEPVKFMWQAFAFGVLLTSIVVVIGSLRNEKLQQIMLTGLIIIEILLAIRVSSLFTDAAARGTYRDISVTDKIESLLMDDVPDRRILYITEDDSSFISVLQFMMRDVEITLLPVKGSLKEYTREEINENDILVLYYQSVFSEEADALYSSNFHNGHFYVFYNRP